ncbi:hypothetical protein COCNU_scaffold003611G000010 [Cocos nucifera]|nr:hypothetical protein [Cocos nucifera]
MKPPLLLLFGKRELWRGRRRGPFARRSNERSRALKERTLAKNMLGHYPFIHFEAVNQNWAEASRVLEEVRVEIEKAQAEADILKVASKTHSSEVECLQKELREERSEMARLRAELVLEKATTPILQLTPTPCLIQAFDKGFEEGSSSFKKKLKKVEADLQSSHNDASKAIREITCLHDLHMKDAASFSIRKGSFKKEIAELKKNASDKSWALMAKISFLEADLKEAREIIYLLEGISPWSIDKARYDWD